MFEITHIFVVAVNKIHDTLGNESASAKIRHWPVFFFCMSLGLISSIKTDSMEQKIEPLSHKIRV